MKLDTLPFCLRILALMFVYGSAHAIPFGLQLKEQIQDNVPGTSSNINYQSSPGLLPMPHFAHSLNDSAGITTYLPYGPDPSQPGVLIDWLSGADAVGIINEGKRGTAEMGVSAEAFDSPNGTICAGTDCARPLVAFANVYELWMDTIVVDGPTPGAAVDFGVTLELFSLVSPFGCGCEGQTYVQSYLNIDDLLPHEPYVALNNTFTSTPLNPLTPGVTFNW